MILLCGIPSERPLAMVAGELDHVGAPYTWFNQRRFESMDLRYTIDGGRVRGELAVDSDTHDLNSIDGAYVRLMDDRLLPEVEDLPETSERALKCRRLHDTLTRWLEVSPGRVVSRYSAMGSNGSKPYQAQLIRAFGFKTPETMVTNDPEAVVDFWHRHGRIIYKSISGQRSIVTEFTQDDLGRLDAIRTCPTQFQVMIEGRMSASMSWAAGCSPPRSPRPGSTTATPSRPTETMPCSDPSTCPTPWPATPSS